MKQVIWMLILMIIFLPGCSNKYNNNQSDSTLPDQTNNNQVDQSEDDNWEDETVAPVEIGERLCDELGFPDQSVPPEYYWINSSDTDDVETEYDNFSITLDRDEFSYNSYIRIHIENKNDKPFAYYPIPYVEKYDAEEQSWERLIYAPDEAYYASGWYTGIDDVTLYFNPYFMSVPLDEGEYRFIIFAGDKEFYSDSFYIAN